jgi:hypothetical protein
MHAIVHLSLKKILLVAFMPPKGPKAKDKDWIIVTSLRRSFFWAALYLAVIFVLGQTDYFGRPIIDFASYFYLAVMIAVPATLFFPLISRVSSVVPLAFWAVVYVIILLFVARGRSSVSEDLSVIVLGVHVLLEQGSGSPTSWRCR